MNPHTGCNTQNCPKQECKLQNKHAGEKKATRRPRLGFIINLYKTCIHIRERTQKNPKIHFMYIGNKKTEVLIFSLIFFQSLFMHSLSL